MESNEEYLKAIVNEVGILDVCEKLGIDVVKKGNDHMCLCPFHDDHHPSMAIYNTSKQFHCFTCGTHGNIFTLIKQKKGYNEFYDVVKWVENEFPEVLSFKPKLIKINDSKSMVISNTYDLANEYYKNMNQNEEERLKEFSNKRGYNLEFLKNSEVFYAMKNKLCNNIEKKNYESLDKLESKMLIKRIANFKESDEIEYKDYFNERIIIVLRNYYNNVVGFSGRTIGDEKPKYLFSKSLPKSSFLYRLNDVRAKIFKENHKSECIHLYLVEGIFDALRLESLGINAVAVLGSHITQEQTEVLEKFIDDLQQKNIEIFIHIFMDSDKAGIDGIYSSIKNILKSNVGLKAFFDVVIIKKSNDIDYDYKDADEFLKTTTDYNDANEKLEENTIDIFEFLYMYFAPDIDMRVEKEPTKLHEKIKSDEIKIVILNNIKNMISEEIWKVVINRFYSIYRGNEDKVIFNDIKNYLLNINGKVYSINLKDSSMLSSMQNALELSKNSYKKEILALDDYTWEKILMGADAFYEYFVNLLKNYDHIRIPLLSMYLPKNKHENRKKRIYIHEQLITQQYVLNELLKRDSNRKYEYCIPAVRYNPDQKETTITTGKGYYDFFRNSCDKVVSFAYQISTKAVNEDTVDGSGMFRPFYQCWKEYIGFIQDGIKRLSSDTVYRVKLDIKGFYDNISDVNIRSTLINPINEALKNSNNRFEEIGWNNNGDKIVEWIIGELFDYKYYDSKAGNITDRENTLIGIPQGPNLSAYIANIILFKLDLRIMEYVNKINKSYREQKLENYKDEIVVRYARYVDDMIIISSESDCILEIKKIVESELYELGLLLSDKTDEADSISKDEAIDWTTSEKGGLGVSSVFDFVDEEDIDTIIENNFEWDRIDRHNALKMLSSLYINTEFEDIITNNSDFENIEKLFFKTEEVRFNDIVRFSKSMICNIIKDIDEEIEINLLSSFKFEWEELTKSSPKESLFKREKIEDLAFLEAIIQLMNIEIRIDDVLYKENYICKIQKRIINLFKKYNLINTFKESLNSKTDDILSINKYFIEMKIISLVYVINKKKQEFNDNDYLKYEIDDIKNEYYLRWVYCNEKSENYSRTREYLKDNYSPSGKSIINSFNYIISNINNINNIDQYKAIIERVVDKDKDLLLGLKNDILAYCIKVWTNNKEFLQEDFDIEKDRIALKVLISFIPKSVLPEIIRENKHLVKCIFRNEIKKYLPVFPGVKYPGIFGLNDDNNKLAVERIDFNDINEQNYCIPETGWILDNSKEDYCEIKMFKYEPINNIMSLSDYIEMKGKESYDKCIVTISKLYEKLYKKIEEIQDKNESVCLLSKDNIYISRDSGELEIFCYSLSQEVCNYSVAVQSTKDSYTVRNINEDGNQFWQAGFILKDALNLDNEILHNLQSNDTSIKEALTLLNYSFNRLTGKNININYKKRSLSSYKRSIERIIDFMIKFTECKEDRKKYLLNCFFIDNYISYRMKQPNYDYSNGNIFYYLSLWANNCLMKKHIDLKQAFIANNIKLLDEDIKKSSTMRRVVASNYLLSLKINKLFYGLHSFRGLELLSKGLLCNAILLNIKMQVFEQIEMLSSEQKDLFVKKIQELPYELLKYDDRIILIVNECEKDSFIKIVNKILSNEYDPDVNSITPLGWLLILGFILEIDDCTSYIRGKYINHVNVKNLILQLKDLLLEEEYIENSKSESSSEKEDDKFPFEQIDKFIEKWNNNTFNKAYDILEKIDKETNTKVELVSSEFLSVSSNKKNVSIQLDNCNLNKIKWFVTCGILPNRNITIEKDENGFKKFTQTINNGEIVGISYIEDALSKLSSDYFEGRNESNIAVDQKEVIIADNQKDTNKENKQLSKGESDFSYSKDYDNQNDELSNCNKELDTESENIEKDKIIEDNVHIDKYEGDIQNNNKNLDNSKYDNNVESLIRKKLKRLFDARDSNWGFRSKKTNTNNTTQKDYSFKNIDRIALFQFNIDQSSYYHPDIEKCDYLVNENYKNNTNDKYSVVEFRRRKLLLPVLDACEKFGVEILVLPEYSVRPETVKWLAKKLEHYSFSIWAGTFKVTPGYKFADETLNTKNYSCSAILPIILNKTYKCYGDKVDKIQIITDRIKKYPSITLDEVINNCEANKDMFYPALKRNFKGTLFCDARDDVIELICAEMFLMSSPSNFISFSHKAYEMHDKFFKGTSDYKLYLNGVRNDIGIFGEHISLYQTNNKYDRTPIILVPACTTRAADYYASGQANYLAAGLTTVFCNSSGNQAKGGSCFIGQYSWDDYQLGKKNSKINEDEIDFGPKNTIYHGIQPGIFQQSCNFENRGGLGEKEQALLICDVDPQITFKGKPNPESIRDSLTVVAHIPIIEEDIFSDDKCNGCKRNCYGKNKNRNLKYDEIISLLNKDEDTLSKAFNNLKNLNEIIINNSRYTTTIEDKEPERIKEILSNLAKESNSSWLNLRGETYLKQHKNNPMYWPAPTFLDLLYIVVNYNDFFEDVDLKMHKKGKYVYSDTNYEIQMPSINNE